MRIVFNKQVCLLLALLFMLTSCFDSKSEKKIREDKIAEAPENFKIPPLPDHVTFCGENFLLSNFDIRERLDKELIVNTYFHSHTTQAIKRANRYFELIEDVLIEQEIPDDFKYLCLIESGLTQARSPAGALGFWQFMPQTANQYGLRVDGEVDERMHIQKSTIAACRYLKDANEKFDNWLLTSASYNRGIAGIESDLEEQGVSNYFDLHLNSETSRYVFRILAMKIIFENKKAYGYDPDNMELYEPIKTRRIEISESIGDVKKWAKNQGSNYRMLKLLNPWIIGNRLTYNDSTLIIELPI